MVQNPLFSNQKKIDKPSDPVPVDAKGCFKVLIIDDETEVHRVTDLTLKRFRFDGHKVEFLHAYSAAEAKNIFQENDDIALALVDVVMETDHAGLDLVHYVRKELKNHTTRLVLRTGQPGQAPEHEIIEKYDINDYKEKTELTSQKLKTLMYTGLRSYRDIDTIERHRKGLRRVIECTSQVLKPHSINTFASAVLDELVSLLQLPSTAIYCSSMKIGETDTTQVLAASKDMLEFSENTKLDSLPVNVRTSIETAVEEKRSCHFDDSYVFYTQTDRGMDYFLYIDTQGKLTESNKELLEIYCINVALTYENLLISEEVVNTQRELVYLLGEAVEMRSTDISAHVKRVAIICQLIASYCKLPEAEVVMMKQASPLHDLGKVAIPDRILHKPGPLEGEDLAIMQTHAKVGYDILKRSKNPVLQLAAQIALTHHEKWDGSGYPTQLKGDDIPLSGRITAIADVFDVLGSQRCFKDSWDTTKIKQLLVDESGKHFDPKLVDIIIENFEQFCAIRHQFPD
ncbi:MAG: DUF3369 domain-containing protein [Aliiglaciecola sp.]|uniref:DUF3369 domain-containing protein n=1 Tax=Aliiglaciecola sp. TaxID=1872441 RepID=UPI00329A015E